MAPITIIILVLLVLIFMRGQTVEGYSDNRVDYPLDAYPDLFPSRANKMLHKLPYDNLTTRHYKQNWTTKTTPKCVEDGTCPQTPGYYKTYPDYFDNPKKLKSYQLGYSVTGFPYNDYKFPIKPSEERSGVNLSEPVNKEDYPEWFDYKTPRKEALYMGYPFNYHGKIMR